MSARRATVKHSKPVRYLYFIRHGQHVSRDGIFGGTLTTLGRRQVRLTAKRLAEWPIQTIHASDLNRAVESAALIAERLGGLRVQKTPILREVTPLGVGYPSRWKARSREMVALIHKRHFRPCRKTRHELFVCHGQVIRSLTCVVQGLPLTRWGPLATSNCGITRFAVWYNGKVTLLGYNDTGHIPADLITTVA